MDSVVNLAPPYIKEYTVSEISHYIRQVIENNYGFVRIRGEISGLKIATSGHAYFNLKDENAVLATTCWRGSMLKMQVKLEEGMEVIATGKMTTYAGQSRYQLTVESVELAGAGALMKLLLERKAKLQAEGLFDNTRKKPLPFFPSSIGVVTSLSGAVIRDIIHRISDRCPVRVIIWPVLVQGESAAGEVAAAIRGFEALKPDVIIVARGGGSIEDLWAFNEEIVVRAVAASSIPIISAVGHETDFTLTDFAADIRAPTPTAAAEFATPVIADLSYTLRSHELRLSQALCNMLKSYRELLYAYDRALAHPMSLVMRCQQRLDDISLATRDALPKLLMLRSAQLKQYRLDFINPVRMLPAKLTQLESLSSRQHWLASNYLQKHEARLNLAARLLSSLDYKNVLKRGFAVIRDESSNILSSAAKVAKAKSVVAELRDGHVKLKTL